MSDWKFNNCDNPMPSESAGSPTGEKQLDFCGDCGKKRNISELLRSNPLAQSIKHDRYYKGLILVV